jgi:hypothetical protein
MKKFEEFPEYEYSVRDEKPKKEYRIRWGWYTVYLLMVCINSVMATLHGFGISTWQFWIWATMLIICFVAGSNYRDKED